MDPVSAIANAAGGLFSAISTVAGGRQQIKLSDIQSDQAMNSYIISQQEAQENSQKIILGVMLLAMILLIILIIYINK